MSLKNNEMEKYDYIIKFDIFESLFNNKKLNIIYNSKRKDIYSDIFFCVSIKSTNLSLQSQFINLINGTQFSSEKDKDEILFLAYYDFGKDKNKTELYLFINYIDDLGFNDLIKDEYQVLKDLTNKFLINFSDIYILLIDEDDNINEEDKKELINEIVKEKEIKKCFIIHAVSNKNKEKIKEFLENNTKEYSTKSLKYENNNNSNVIHLIYEKDEKNSPENKNITTIFDEEIKKDKIRNENFYDEYYEFLMIHFFEKYYKMNILFEKTKGKKFIKNNASDFENNVDDDSKIKYDYILYFESFLNFINDKKFTIQNNFNNIIPIQSNIFFFFCIKGNNFKLQTKFINDYTGLNFSENETMDGKFFLHYQLLKNNLILLINYEEYNEYIINKNLLKNYELSDIIEDQNISLNFLNYFLDKFSQLYILILDEDENEIINEKLIQQSINENNIKKYMIIHSINKNNKKKILQKFNDEKYSKIPIINELFEEITNDNNLTYYYMENKNKLCHFIYEQDNKLSNGNEDLFNLIENIALSYIPRDENNFNFYDKFYESFNFYISQMFNNIKTTISDNNYEDIEINLLTEEKELEKKIISSQLIVHPEIFELKYLYKNIDNKYINFYIETETKANKIGGKIINGEENNIVKISKILFDDTDRKNNAIFSNKDSNEKKDIEIKISYFEGILEPGVLNQNNQIKTQNGIISFKCPILNLEQNLSINFENND